MPNRYPDAPPKSLGLRALLGWKYFLPVLSEHFIH